MERYVILDKAIAVKPYTRVRRGKTERIAGYERAGEARRRIRRGKLERVKGYPGRSHDPYTYHGTSAKNVYKILFEGVRPQDYHNFRPEYFVGERERRIFVSNSFEVAAVFAKIAEDRQGSPAIVIEARIPSNYWEKNAKPDEEFISAGEYGLPEIKPEWITNVYDAATKKIITEAISSLKLERFKKAGRVVYIPVTLEVFKKMMRKYAKKA